LVSSMESLAQTMEGMQQAKINMGLTMLDWFMQQNPQSLVTWKVQKLKDWIYFMEKIFETNVWR
jgi:hypothetical protein